MADNISFTGSYATITACGGGLLFWALGGDARHAVAIGCLGYLGAVAAVLLMAFTATFLGARKGAADIAKGEINVVRQITSLARHWSPEVRKRVAQAILDGADT